MSRIFVTGDTHGEHSWHKLSTKSWPTQKELTKDDYLIVAGDWGGIWEMPPDKGSSAYRIKSYNERNFTTLFVDGNHDRHDYYATLPVETWNGGKIHRVSDSIIHLMRGQVFDIDGRRIFTMGGADSVDKLWRIPGVSWWPEEMPNIAEYNEAVANLGRVGFKVDYVITHCCGTQLLYQMYTHHSQPDTLTNFLWDLEKDHGLEFKTWFFGHHHQDITFDDGKHRCLYHNIVEVE